MPTYDYECRQCGAEVRDHVRRIADPDPEHCGQPMSQVFLTPRRFEASFLGSYRNPGYRCIVTDEWVDSKRKRREIEKRERIIEAG